LPYDLLQDPTRGRLRHLLDGLVQLFSQRRRDLRAKRGASPRTLEDQGLGTLVVIGMNPSLNGFVFSKQFPRGLCGIFALSDLIQRPESLPCPRMRGLQGEPAEVVHRLVPSLIIDAQHDCVLLDAAFPRQFPCQRERPKQNLDFLTSSMFLAPIPNGFAELRKWNGC
jgi:hypothetical protein